MFKKEHILFIFLGGFFVANALMAEFIGVKLFSLEKTLGMEPFSLSLLGEKDLSMTLTAGVLLWPVVFIMTDVINDYYGVKGVRLLTFLAAGMIIYAFVAVYLSMELPAADFWIRRKVDENTEADMNQAYNLVFGQGLWIIFASVIAFLLGQFIDAFVFKKIKDATGDKKIWLRATGSTLISQLIDSFVVLFIAFYIGPAGFSFMKVLAICVVNYSFKFVVAIILTPVLYLIHALIEKYLGKDKATQLRLTAINSIEKE